MSQQPVIDIRLSHPEYIKVKRLSMMPLVRLRYYEYLYLLQINFTVAGVQAGTISIISALSGFLSLTKASTLLFFSQRIGFHRENSPPLKSVLFIWPFLLILFIDLGMSWGIVCGLAWWFYSLWHLIAFIAGNFLVSAFCVAFFELLRGKKEAQVVNS